MASSPSDVFRLQNTYLTTLRDALFLPDWLGSLRIPPLPATPQETDTVTPMSWDEMAAATALCGRGWQ